VAVLDLLKVLLNCVINMYSCLDVLFSYCVHVCLCTCTFYCCLISTVLYVLYAGVTFTNKTCLQLTLGFQLDSDVIVCKGNTPIVY